MINNSIDLERFIIQRTIRRFSETSKAILTMIYNDIEKNNTSKKANVSIGSGITSHSTNMISKNSEDNCTETLVAICYEGDDLDEIFCQLIDLVHCSSEGISKEVFLFTTHWNSVVIKKYIGDLEVIRANGVVVNLIYVTKKGVALMPV